MPQKTYFAVNSPGFSGSYALTTTNAARLPDGPGVYILGNLSTKEKPLAMYVGRTVSLGRRVGEHVGEYAFFYYKETDTVNGAFFIECSTYHQYGKSNYLDNEIHPAVPAGSSLPACSEPGCYGEAD